MKKQFMIIGIVTLLVCVGLSGCNDESNTQNTDKAKFIGTWKTSDNGTLVFFSDGRSTIFAVNGTWELKDGHLVLASSDLDVQTTCSYIFSNSDRTLTLTEVKYGTQTIFTKQ